MIPPLRHLARRLRWPALLAVAVLGVFATRVHFARVDALRAAHAAATAGHVREAIADYEAAGRAHLPLADDGEVCRALEAIGADEKQPLGLRAAAWRAMRSMVIASRSASAPDCAPWIYCDLACMNHQIATLEAADPEGAPAAGDTLAARTAWYADRFAADPRPGSGTIALTAIGFLAFLAGAAALVRRPRWWAGIVAIAGLVVWAAGLYNA